VDQGRRPFRGLHRRTAAGVAALAAATLGAALLVPAWDTGDAVPKSRGPVRQAATGPLDEDGAQREAKRTGKRVEATALRSVTSTTYALPDGSFELTAHAAPIRARVGGVWKPIDTRLERTGNGWRPRAAADPVVFHDGSAKGRAADDPGAAEPAAAPNADQGRADRANLRLSSAGAVTTARHRTQTGTSRLAVGSSVAADSAEPQYTDLVTFTSGGHLVTVGWPGPLPAPEIDGSRAVYRNVFSGVDLMLTARDSGFSHVLVIHNATAATHPGLARLSYRFTSPDLTFHHDQVTGVTTGRNVRGEQIAVSPTPFMWDSGGTPTGTGSPPQPTTTPDPPGFGGPQPGAATATAASELQGNRSSDAVLSVVPNTAMLTSPSTVWPVYVDPSMTGMTKAWTTIYSKHQESSFWDGANFNSGTVEGRAGYESDTMGISRSYFRLMWYQSIKGAQVSDATIRLRNTYSWSCQARAMEVHHSGDISPSVTWKYPPSLYDLVGLKSFAKGYNNSCPDGDVTYDADHLGQSAANGGWTGLTIRLKAETESNAHFWKKFNAEGSTAPKIIITYNRRPEEPIDLKMSPGGLCDTKPPYITVGKSDLTFSARSSDKDGDLSKLHFEAWQSGTSNSLFNREVSTNASGAAGTTLLSTDPKLVNGRQYYWHVGAKDASGAYSLNYGPPGSGSCGFVYDSSAPGSPEVTSTDFPEDDGNGTVWSVKKFGTPGSFTFRPASAADGVTKFKYSFNRETYDKEVTAAVAAAGFQPNPPPPNAGPNILYVKAVDSAANMSLSGTKYLHYVTPRDQADTPGDVTGDASPDLYAINAAGHLRLYPSEKGTGDIHMSQPAAHQDGRPIETDPDVGDYWIDAQGNPALITHNGDFMPGDGVQDLVARMPDGKLYIYPGDGYGGVDIDRRTLVRLPANAPATSSLTQILAAGDITGDGRPELFATAGDAFWVFTGYTGASFETAMLLSASAWTNRDLVTIGDVNGDGEADMVYRAFSTNQLTLRLGRPAAAGGTELSSLAAAANSLGGADTEYGWGWSATAVPKVIGTPSVNSDSTPDLWALASNGYLRYYAGTTTGNGPSTEVAAGWGSMKAIG
jgi:hypothetical protein